MSLSNVPDGNEAGGLTREMENAWRVITAAERVLVLTHANPDADAIASACALDDALRARGQVAVPVVGDGVLPGDLRFIPGSARLADPATLRIQDFDLLLLVDCAEPQRLGPLYQQHPEWFNGERPLVNIDHHVTNARFGVAHIVDPNAAASCEVLTLLFETVGAPIGPQLATALAAGIYGDTLGLQTPSTTSRTMRIAADLLDRGADTLAIVDNLFRLKPFSTIKLWGQVLDRAERLGDLIWTEITPAMLAASGAVPAEGEGIVNFIAGCAEAHLAVLFYLREDGWRVSLRSITDIDVSQLARHWGGGGHSRAAGCTLTGGVEVRDAFLNELAAMVAALVHAPAPAE